jgi:hypothetical protein
MTLTNKHKTFSITTQYRGIELDVIAVTTSKKKFAELVNTSLSHVNNYAYSYDLRYPVCNENPEVLYAKVGLGGEGRYFFDKDEIMTHEDAKAKVDNHRKTYANYRDYLKQNNLY